MIVQLVQTISHCENEEKCPCRCKCDDSFQVQLLEQTCRCEQGEKISRNLVEKDACHCAIYFPTNHAGKCKYNGQTFFVGQVGHLLGIFHGNESIHDLCPSQHIPNCVDDRGCRCRCKCKEKGIKKKDCDCGEKRSFVNGLLGDVTYDLVNMRSISSSVVPLMVSYQLLWQ